MEERDYYLAFSFFSGIGPVTFAKLLKRFGLAKNIWNSSLSDLKEELNEALANKFDTFRDEFSIKDYQQRLYRNKVSFLILTDKEYPVLLKQTKKPPFVLYIKGSVSTLISNKTIGVVGTRKVTQYGRDVTELLVYDLISAGFTIVSGLAMGVDAVAHKTTVENSGTTIAVLGCGVDCVTPEENRALYNSILGANGCIVSELPLGHSPTMGSFPARNRIIAGLSEGILVTEGAEDSGSLITADFAFKYGRPVFAVPGPITSSLSKGPYNLISRGAKLVTSAQDIIKELQTTNSKLQILASQRSGSNKSQKQRIKNGSKEEEKILELLENEALRIDEIVKRTKLKPAKISSILSMMEIKGIIKSSGSLFSIAS